MPSTYSDSLRIELISTGSQPGQWGQTTNRNLGTLIEQAIAGVGSISHPNTPELVLTTINGQVDQARNAVLVFTGTLTADRDVVCPAQPKTYLVANNTSGGFALTIRTDLGSGVTIPNGGQRLVFCDGSDVRDAITDLPAGATVAGSPVGDVPSTLTITAGDGLSGGGSLEGDITLSVDLDDDSGLSLSASGLKLDTGSSRNIDHSGVNVNAGNGLTGGGAITENVTITMGTPGTLSGTTTNTVSGSSHNHAISSTSSRTSTSTSLLLEAAAMNSHRTSGDHDNRHLRNTDEGGGRVRIVTSAPTSGGVDGDIWFVVE